MNLNFEKAIKLAQQISFTTFLILCVAVMGYAVIRLYDDNRTDWDKVQINSQRLEKLDEDITILIGRINKLIDLLSGQYNSKPDILPNRGPVHTNKFDFIVFKPKSMKFRLLSIVNN